MEHKESPPELEKTSRNSETHAYLTTHRVERKPTPTTCRNSTRRLHRSLKKCLDPSLNQLCIVKIPFKDVNSCLSAMKKQGKLIGRLSLEYDTLSMKEVVSLFQYDAVEQHFRVPILESAWKALPDNTIMTILVGDNYNSPRFHQLRNKKVPFKRKGIVIAKYSQPLRTNAGTTDSFQPIICSENTEEYRMQTAFVGPKATIELWCEVIVSDSNNGMVFESPAVAKLPYTFSCAVDSYELENIDENQIQAILYKRKTFNTGRTALPFRLIDDSELLPLICGQDIGNYLEETMICDLMFCSPTDIESRATAFNGPVLLTDDAFLALRLIIEQLWQLGSNKEKTLPPVVRIEIQEPRKTSPVMILDVEGYYMYGGLPLVKIRFMELEINSSALKTNKETTTIYVKYRRCLELLRKMLFTNSLRMSQEGSTSLVNTTTSSSQSLNTFLQMVFVNDDGKVMQSALHEYPLNTGLVRNYIGKVYSASIRQNFVAPRKATEIWKKQMKEMRSSCFAEAAQFLSGEHKSDSAMTKNSSSLSLNQQTSCSECKKSTTDLKKCARCMSVVYCSKDCQVKNWPKHKKECASALSKTDDGSSTKGSNKSGCPTEPKNLSGSSIKKSKTQDSVTNESRIMGASYTKEIENDLLTKAKIDDCSSVESNGEGSSIVYRRESQINSEGDSALKPKTEYCISNSKNDDGGSSAKTKEGDPFSTMEANDAVSYFESAFEDSAKAYKSSLQSKFQASHSSNKEHEIDSSLKADNSSQPHSHDIRTNNQNDGVSDNSRELCTSCRLENSNMKKCTKCKSATYCSRECQRADWKRHRSECQTQQFPSTVPLMSRCNGCGVLGTKMKKCSQCKSACYCSPECQRIDWKTHKITCRRP